MTEPANTLPRSIETLFEAVEQLVESCDAFAGVDRQGDRLSCLAIGPEVAAEYFLSFEDGSIWAGLATQDRWLSQSIEADLLNTGDSMVELVEEELADLDCSLRVEAVEHFRDAQMRYTFRTKLPDEVAAQDASLMLRGYEAAFGELGDMMPSDED